MKRKCILLLLLSICFFSFVYPQNQKCYLRKDVQHDIKLYCRENPDITSSITDTLANDTDNRPFYADWSFTLIDYTPDNQWVKIEINYIKTYAKNGRIRSDAVGSAIRYVPKKDFDENVELIYRVKPDKLIPLYFKANNRNMSEEKVTPKISGYNSQSPIDGYVGVVSGINKEWGKVYKQMWSNYALRGHKVLYVKMEDVLNNAEPVIVEKTEPNTLDVASSSLSDNFHWYILFLAIASFVFAIILPEKTTIKFFVLYTILLAMSAIEVYYIGFLGKTFWFCSPSYVGWIKTILFTILSIVIIVWQFLLFFMILDEIKERSKPFNSYIGTGLMGIIVVIAFIYAIFSELDDEQNELLIKILISTQVLQALVAAYQLRKYPLMMLLTILIMPLGIFAILLSFLRIFAILCVLALFAIVAYGISHSVGNPTDDKAGGDFRLVAKNCRYYENERCGMHMGNCSMVKSGKCKYGQM